MTIATSERLIPTVDIRPYLSGDDAAKAQVASAIDTACRTSGFLLVSGHGVSAALIDDVRRTAREFLSLPADVKLQYLMGTEGYRGYAMPGTQSLAASYGDESPPDIKESFSIGPIDVPDDPYFTDPRGAQFFAPNRWPIEVPELRESWCAYYGEMERLSTDLMRLFALALGMPEHFFDDKIDRHGTVLSAIHYPPLVDAPLPGQLRGGAHTDFGSLTIVQRDAAPGGLQVELDGEWFDVPYVADTFVVNIGDLMAEWTNDRWVSTMHRVVTPETLDDHATDRLAFTFFLQPNYDARIEVLPTCCGPDNPAKYRDTTSGEHFVGKLMALRTPELDP